MLNDGVSIDNDNRRCPLALSNDCVSIAMTIESLALLNDGVSIAMAIESPAFSNDGVSIAMTIESLALC